jgi:acyl-CoA reductase-like NAD-dependent aldehyde dehydrogenase
MYPAPGTVRPDDGTTIEQVPWDEPSILVEMEKTARNAQQTWAARHVEQRAELLQSLAQSLLAGADEGVRLLSLEMGRGATDARLSELATVGEYVRDVIRVGRTALCPEKVRLSFLDFPGKRGMVELLPRGVVGIIAPWNYPLLQFYKPLFPALLAGNTVILKPSEHTPRTGLWLAERCKEVLPAGVVQVVTGGGELGAALVAHVDALTFTGSVATGRKVAAAAAERLIPVSLELGGKDAAVVLSDCNLERTIAGLTWASMHNAGQDCAGVERVYVEEKIADAFVDGLAATVSQLEVAPKGRCDIGPLQNAAQLKLVQEHVASAVEAGAQLRCGGETVGSGYGFQPTVLDQCTQNMDVVRDETFGPVVAVIRVQDAEEAIRLANDSRYGLNGSVWTQDLVRGEALARRLEVGIAHVNGHKWTGGTLAQTPWTGVKDTGPGIAASRHAYGLFTRPRTVMVDKNAAPEPYWFPADANLGAFSEALVARGRGKFTALLTLLGLLGKRVKAAKAFVRLK